MDAKKGNYVDFLMKLDNQLPLSKENEETIDLITRSIQQMNIPIVIRSETKEVKTKLVNLLFSNLQKEKIFFVDPMGDYIHLKEECNNYVTTTNYSKENIEKFILPQIIQNNFDVIVLAVLNVFDKESINELLKTNKNYLLTTNHNLQQELHLGDYNEIFITPTEIKITLFKWVEEAIFKKNFPRN